MNLGFLGDALDHWKGSVFEGLKQSNLLHNFRIDAMASDAEVWKPQDLTLFAKLLRIRQEQLIPHQHTLGASRSSYFAEIPDDCDVFLGPDTGFKTGKVKNIRQYIKPEEFLLLLKRNKNQVIVVYQHVRAKLTRDRVEEVLRILYDEEPGLFCTSYESGTVALLFFSLDHGRIKSIRGHFHVFLDNHAENRIDN